MKESLVIVLYKYYIYSENIYSLVVNDIYTYTFYPQKYLKLKYFLCYIIQYTICKYLILIFDKLFLPNSSSFLFHRIYTS